jgi:hypothetical protein
VNVRPARQLWLPLCVKSDTFALGPVTEHPVGDEQLMERVLERENLVPALKRVEQNKGSAGVDVTPVSEGELAGNSARFADWAIPPATGQTC